MRLIPGKTKVGLELFKGITLKDMAVYAVAVLLAILALFSNLPRRVYLALAVLTFGGFLTIRLDTEPVYVLLVHLLRYLFRCRFYGRKESDAALAAENEGMEPADEADSFDWLSDLYREVAAEAELSAAGNPDPEAAALEDADFDWMEELREQEEAEAPETGGETEEQLSKAEKKNREKAEQAENKRRRQEEDRLLKAVDTPEEVRTAIRERRSRDSAEYAARAAIRKDAALKRQNVDDIMAFTDIRNDMIEYGRSYRATVLEIPPVEFRFFSSHRRDNAIENGLGRLLRSIRSDYGMNIVKIDRPINYETYLENEYQKLEELRSAYEKGFIKEEELQTRVEVMYDRIGELRDLCSGHQVVEAYYYIVLFDSDAQQLNTRTTAAVEMLTGGEMSPRRLNSKELAVFLKYTNDIDFDEHEIDRLRPDQYAQWAKPQTVDISGRTVQVNRMLTHNAVVSQYPSSVGDGWLATVMSIIGTKVVIKCSPMDNGKAIHSIDQSLQELRSRQMATGIDSRRIELQNHIDTLTSLLDMLQGDNEVLLNCNIYVTEYDLARTRKESGLVQPEAGSLRTLITDMKRTIRRTYSENRMKLNYMEFNQTDAFIASQVSGYDPLRKQGRGIPSNSIAAAFPWVFAHVSDHHGIKLGSADGIPVFINFFRRDTERVNSNMVIVGKSGSGKSYATKSLLTNLAADDAKIFILDPENEYAELAQNLHGKFINVGNAQYGRLNPFHIITALEDDENDSGEAAGSYATHLQFLEEFFHQILPDCDKDALEYLNSLIDRMYVNKGITEETDLSRLRPEDYPIFDDLYDTILQEFQGTDNEYIRSMLRTLMNYISKFAAGGRNAAIWDGPSSITTAENFTVFNFQSLLANRNGTIANAQMLLVLKYIDNEIIKNRDYNTKYGLNRKIVVVIDEAHVFIDTKYPVALDFMFQLAKRIRKYNGMQIVITQNIKDFVGSEEIARKSTAIINACQYSFIFALAPNDMDDLCRLYEKAGGINEMEQEEIVSAPRGHAFTVMGPQSRSSFLVEVPEGIVELFQEQKHRSRYFSGTRGDQRWLAFLKDSRRKRADNLALRPEEERKQLETGSSADFSEQPDPDYRWTIPPEEESKSRVTFTEISEEEYRAQMARQKSKQQPELPVPVQRPQRSTLIPASEQDPQLSFREEGGRTPVIPAVPVQAEAAAPAAEPVRQETAEMEGMVSELRKLVENLSRLSYEGIEDKVRAMMAATGSPIPAAEKPAAAPAEEAPEPETEESWIPEEAPEPASIGSVFDFAAPAEPEPAPVQTESSNNDLLGLLFRSANLSRAVREPSELEMMEIYGEEVMDITLDDLAKYIANLSATA